MAPQKRSRRDSRDEDVISVERASSSLRAEVSHKKQRLSINPTVSKRTARGSSPESSDDDSDLEVPDASAIDDPPPAATQYELMRDGNFEHLRDTAADDAKAQLAFERRSRNRIGNNRAADNAIIETITCINFMCHEKLHVELGPLINFIVGHNGSGKSAVLTAVTLCLGGKVASTNRGSSLKSMIRSGCDNSILIIKMKNQGDDAYQHDVFGDSIIIERHFSKNGSSGYRLKSAAGRVISTRKLDIDDIVEYYQLQVDNPMNILTQDAAKSFIQTSTDSDKYRFFYKGVQLEALDHDYQLVSDTCDQVEGKLNEAKEVVLSLKKAADVAEEKLAVVRQHEGLRTQLRVIFRKVAWSQVKDVEADSQALENGIAGYEDQLRARQRVLDDKDEELQRVDLSLEQARQSVTTLVESAAPLRDDEETARTAHEHAMKNVAAFRETQKSARDQMREDEKKVKSYQEKIESQNRLQEAASGGAHAQKLSELASAEQAAEDARSAQIKNQQERPQLEQERQNAFQEHKRSEGPLSAKAKEVENAKTRLQHMNQDRGNVMAGYDANMSRLIQTINNDRGFLEKPIGPMGLHIKLKDPIWSHILESTIGNSLSGFLVTSKADQVRLRKMLNQVNLGSCQVSIINHHPINTTGNEPDEQYMTILRALEFDNELVKKHLIVSMAIEQIILVKEREGAIRIMYSGSKPNKVRACFCLHQSELRKGIRLGFTGGHHQDMTPIQEPKTAKPRMKSDIEQQIAYQRESVKQLEDQVRDLQNKRRQLQTNLSKCDQALKINMQDATRHKITVQRAEQAVDNLKNEVEQYEPDTALVDGLKENLADAQQQLAISQEAYGNLALEKDACNAASAEKKNELSAVKDKLQQHEVLLKKAEAKVRSKEAARRTILTDKNQAVDNVEEVRLRLEKEIAKRPELAKRLAEFETGARQVCPERVHLEPDETYGKLEPLFNNLKARLTKATEKQRGTDQEINDAAVEADRIFKKARSERRKLAELLQLLKQSLLRRIEMFRRFQRGISAGSRISFNYLLSERAFRGRLLIDHAAKKLQVNIEPDETRKSSKGRATKTLSGGEKSFSSICLLLALWEAMGAPMRCLDEFDVFMDDVNRDVSTRLIIDGARRSVGRQFILISPKALGAGAGATDSPDVKITKMHDPREKQMRIDEMMDD